jgi:hypothetical protein
MQIILYANYFLIALAVIKIILFLVLILRRPKVWEAYSLREKLMMTIPFGVGRKAIRHEDWQALRWNQILTETIIYLLLFRVLGYYVLSWVLQSDWIKHLRLENM